MKNIDIKSLIIGGLLASTILLGVAAVPKDTGNSFRIDAPEKRKEWDDKQAWYVERREWDEPKGHANRLTNRLQPHVGLGEHEGEVGVLVSWPVD